MITLLLNEFFVSFWRNMYFLLQCEFLNIRVMLKIEIQYKITEAKQEKGKYTQKYILKDVHII